MNKKSNHSHRLLSALLSLAIMAGLLGSLSITARAYDLNIDAMIQRMYDKYQQYVGTIWTNDNSYISKSGWGGRGCVGFAWLLSDEAFDDLPVRVDYNYKNVRVGDIVRLRWDNHSVIVIDVYEDYTIKVAEGNYGNTVVWGNIYDLKGDDFNYILTRWPSDYPYTYTPKTWLDGCTFSEIPDQTYTGQAICPKPVITLGGITLVENVDYTLEYYSNVNVGTSSIYARGIGRYAGTQWTSFNIIRKELSDDMIAPIPDYTYTGSAIQPFVSVKDGSTILKKTDDYYPIIRNNVDVGTATVEIYSVASGNYTGKASKTFRIVADPTPKIDISYRTYVQTYGWTPYVKDKSVSGTYAQAKHMESIQVKLSKKDIAGGVTYRTYVQKDGWKPWVKDGALSGTKGESKRVEAVQIKLYGNVSSKYDVYYQVYSQSFGWLGWAKNGESSGTAGLSKRLEAIRVVAVSKGGKAPGKTSGAFVRK